MISTMESTEEKVPVLTSTEIDAIGEVLNISMGSSATAISTMLDKQVLITTPKVDIKKFSNFSYAALEPAIMVNIQYIQGLTGSNIMIFRQSDMQVILNLLMGIEEEPSSQFVFDEMAISAACEVMNQMMGASATALSSFLGKTINISTPQASVLDNKNSFENSLGIKEEEEIVAISFTIDIKGVMTSQFVSVMSCELAHELVDRMMDQNGLKQEEAETPENPGKEHPGTGTLPDAARFEAAAQGDTMPPPATMPYGMPQQVPMPHEMPPANQWPMQYAQPMAQPPYGYHPYGYSYGYPTPPPSEHFTATGAKQIEQAQIQTPKFPSFAGQQPPVSRPIGSNMELMMNVPLSVAVEIGKTKKKIREIMDFNQGTVIELEKQAGSPVDIVVNGRLIARGDVVVVDDNFGVRITEIVGTKDLVEELDHGN